MTLEELIATLTAAQLPSGDGHFTVGTDGASETLLCDGMVVIDVDECPTLSVEDLQAIADRNNTAGEVLKELKRLDEAETKARVCREDADTNVARAEKAEAEVADLREENAGLLAAADADAFTIGNLNARVAELERHASKLERTIDRAGFAREHMPPEQRGGS